MLSKTSPNVHRKIHHLTDHKKLDDEVEITRFTCIRHLEDTFTGVFITVDDMGKKSHQKHWEARLINNNWQVKRMGNIPHFFGRHDLNVAVAKFIIEQVKLSIDVEDACAVA